MKKTLITAAVGVAAAAVASAVLLPSGADAAEVHNADRATAEAFGHIADSVLNQRTAALVDSPSAQQTAPLHDKKVRLSSGLERTEGNALSSLKARKKRLNALGEAYSSASTKVSTDKAVIKGGRATVEVTETTTLTYKKVHGDEPSTTGFQAHHELTFSRGSGGKWELKSIKDKDNGLPAINQPEVAAVASTGSFPKATPAGTSWPARPAPKTQKAGGYDYQAMAAYAERYWNRYNPAYRSFNSAGGDCTNFISQSLKAGGWKDAPGSEEDYQKWWYNSSSQSTTWVGANEWSWYALSSKRVTNLSNVFQMDVGDILQMDFDRDGSKDHSMIVTYRSRIGVPYVTYHSTNTYRKSVASLVASYPNATFFAYRT
ncbi:amidase domain-containing protein [Streptomyces sp. NPDC049577]|uniref:amidase domain-containing protein n=1 Tax=Streptomyces sp. NPDC049577 TaxID=3155153 RepID=UPI00341BB2A6